MQPIRLTELAGYSQEGIYEYLTLLEDDSFCVILDRFSDEISYDAETIAREFFHAAFVGEQLWMVANSFSYLVPAAYSTVNFEFEFEVTNLKVLAATLYDFIRVADGDKESIEKYTHKMDLFGKAYSEEEQDPVCLGLLDVFEEAAERAERNQ